jgi:serine/threonine protein kinase
MVLADFQRLGFVEPDFFDLKQWIQQRNAAEIPIWDWNATTKTLSRDPRYISEITFIKFGGYGNIYFVHYKGTSREEYAFMKFKKVKQERLLQEGLIQTLARNCLTVHGFPYAIPRVHTFVRNSEWGLGLCLEQIPGSQILSKYLQSHIQWNTPCITNDTLFLSILVQLASYIAIFQGKYTILHGDLKSTNVLVLTPCATYTKTVNLETNISWSFTSNFKLTIIDFGFAKLHGIMAPSTESRDLFFFLCTLWNIPEFRKSLTPKVVDQIHAWLKDDTTNWAKWLEFSSEDNIHGMYLLTESKRFRNTHCRPLFVLQDIQRLYPDLVQIN